MKRKALASAILLSTLAHIESASGETSLAPAVQVMDLRVGLNAATTRLVFDLSGPVAYTVSTLDNPARVVIDLQGSQTSVDLTPESLSNTLIHGISLETQVKGSLRYVITVTPGTDAHAFVLKPFENHGDRLVVDLQNARDMSGDPSKSLPQFAANAKHEEQVDRVRPPATTATSVPGEPREYTGEWSGYVSLDTRYFFESPEYPEQNDQAFSAAFQPEYYVDWANGAQQFGFSPFLRYDTADDQRTHADIRELYWRLEQDRVVSKVGVDVVFWGVAESQHLVDIINQTDLVENIDGEEKLGQPMVNVDYLSEWGNWQVYLLPYFRERTFPGKHGRLRTEPEVDTRNPEYESGSERNHNDVALRWSDNIGDWDIGLAQFSGTSREPYLIPDNTSGQLRLIPLYQQIDQTSLDAQATKGAWLWKLEAIYNQNKLDDYYAYVGGFERTSFGVAETPADVGLLAEYHYDERGDEATNGLASDVYLGLRFTANDVAGTMALAGLLYDTDTQSSFGNIEASRRLSETWTLGMELRFTDNADEQENFYYIRADDYLGVELTRYF